MANLIIVNRQLKGDVYVGNSKLNFQKGVCQISDTEKDLVPEANAGIFCLRMASCSMRQKIISALN